MDWRHLFNYSGPIHGERKVHCLICDKDLVYNSSTWGTIKKHGDLHIQKHEFTNSRNGISWLNLENNTPIPFRTQGPTDWAESFKFVARDGDGFRILKCRICGSKIKQSRQNWSTLKRHVAKHNGVETVIIRDTPSQYPRNIFWRLKYRKESTGGTKYRIEFRTEPKIKSWMSQESYQLLNSKNGFVILPPNKQLIRKAKRKRDTNDGSEILVEFNTEPVVRTWIKREDFKRINSSILGNDRSGCPRH